MLKKILIIVFITICTPIFAGEYEDAIKSNDNVLLYLYAPSCNYCKIFNPNYENFVKIFQKKCKFLKINTETSYGRRLAEQFRIKFVPYVILVKNRESKGIVITPNCLIEYSCSEKILNDYLN